MARFNEILAGRYNRFLQKLFQLKGGPPAAQLASEVMPIFPFFSGVENRYLEGWNEYMQWFQIAAVAAQTGAVRMRNPPTSNVMVVIEKITYIVIDVTADTPAVQQGPITTDLATLVTGIKNRRDSRIDPQAASVILSQAAAAGSALASGNKLMIGVGPRANGAFSGDFIQTVDQEITVLPGDALQVIGGLVNATFTCAIMWRERPIEESELK